MNYGINTLFSRSKLLTRYSNIFILLLFISPIGGQNVGIGTSTPSEKLTVDGTVRVERNSNFASPHIQLHETELDYTRLKFTNTSTSSYFNIAARPADNSSIARLNLYNSDFGDIFTATAEGRVGINRISPSATFHVDGETGVDPLRIQINNSTKFRIMSNNAISIGTNWENSIADVIRVSTPNMFIGFDGNHVPEDRLEVDGDVMITGGIKANDQDGSPGQILATGSDGNLTWTNPCSYNRFQGFPLPGTVSWTVPDDVTEIMIEAWGAGGGAAFGGGGGAGGYAKAIYTVVPGEVLSVVTGAGGDGTSNGMSSTATDGEASTVIGTTVYVAAIGGQASSNTAVGEGGAFSVSGPTISSTAQVGEDGYPNVNVPIYSGTTKLLHGNGGQSPNAAKNYGQGEMVIITGGTPSDYSPGTSGTTPGGGAGGGSQYGNKGGNGFVIIYWN